MCDRSVRIKHLDLWWFLKKPLLYFDCHQQMISDGSSVGNGDLRFWCLLLRLLGKENSLDVGQNTTLSNGHTT